MNVVDDINENEFPPEYLAKYEEKVFLLDIGSEISDRVRINHHHHHRRRRLASLDIQALFCFQVLPTRKFHRAKKEIANYNLSLFLT